MKLLTDRRDAIAMGHRFYIGHPCDVCGCVERNTKRAMCRQCLRDYDRTRRAGLSGDSKHLERRRQWKAANKDKVAASRLRYVELNRERVRELKRASKQRAKRKAELCLDVIFKRCDSEVERRKLKSQKQVKREIVSPEIFLQRKLARDRLKTKNRRNLQRANGVKITQSQLDAILTLQGFGCAYCGTAKELTLDHKEALARGGLHVPSNLQFLCAFHNTSKNHRDELEYREWKGIPLLTSNDVVFGLLEFACFP